MLLIIEYFIFYHINFRELNNFTTMKPEIEKKLKEAQDELVPIKESTANVIAKIHQITKQVSFEICC